MSSKVKHFIRFFYVHLYVRRKRETGSVADRPRSGRPRVSSRRQNRTIRLPRLRSHNQTATETALTAVGTHDRPFHYGTVRNQLREAGIRADRPYVGPPLTQALCIAW